MYRERNNEMRMGKNEIQRERDVENDVRRQKIENEVKNNAK